MAEITRDDAENAICSCGVTDSGEEHETWCAWVTSGQNLFDEIERLKQALADAHGLLISNGKLAHQSLDLWFDAEQHFTAVREVPPKKSPIAPAPEADHD